MADVRVKLELAGVRDVLNDDGVVGECVRLARDMAGRASSECRGLADDRGYSEIDDYDAGESRTARGNRCGVAYARSDLGRAMQARHSVLTHALAAGRGL